MYDGYLEATDLDHYNMKLFFEAAITESPLKEIFYFDQSGNS